MYLLVSGSTWQFRETTNTPHSMDEGNVGCTMSHGFIFKKKVSRMVKCSDFTPHCLLFIHSNMHNHVHYVYIPYYICKKSIRSHPLKRFSHHHPLPKLDWCPLRFQEKPATRGPP